MTARATPLGSWVAVAMSTSVVLMLILIAVDVVVVNSTQPVPRPVVQSVRVTDAQPVAPVVYLSVAPGVKPAADGKLHDAFSVTNFTVHAGRPVKLVIDNTDSAPHSITTMGGGGVNIIVRPGLHTYTLLVRVTGRFEWMCMMPCDPYSMTHAGYMRGYITSV